MNDRGKRVVALFFLIAIAIPAISQTPFMKGADISFINQIEANGGVFKDSGISKEIFDILKDHGFNYIRLRIWHTPNDSINDLNKTLAVAYRAKQKGFKFLLDFHYSDWWADPAHQTKPVAWEGVSGEALKESVYQYTHDVMSAMNEQNVLPDMVQIGNEISCGFLWNDAHVCGSDNNPSHWNTLGDLLKEGIRAVREFSTASDSILIMIHSDRGGDNSGARWFFDNLLERNLDFDIIGLSYYPWWHGTMDHARINFNDLATRYNKDIIVVETAYPWTLQWADGDNNIVGDSSQLHQGYPATVSGQQLFLSDLISAVKQIPNQRGKGVCYWEPEWITSPTFTSAYENLALFDFDGNTLSSIDAFQSSRIQMDVREGWNLISIPALVTGKGKESLFSSSISGAFSFDSTGYNISDSLRHGIGYWLKFPSNQTITINGDSLLTDTTDAKPGWNLISALSVPIARQDIIEIPAQNISGYIFGYDQGYFIADTLKPGNSYWIQALQQGKLILNSH